MDNEMIVLKWLFPVFLAALAVVHLISCWRGDDDLRKPTKVALMPVVALTYLAFANTPSRPPKATACWQSLLRPLQKHFFALGTASFFLGHVCYLVHIYTTYAVHVRWFWIVLVCAAYAAGIVVVYKGSRKSIPRALRPLALAYMVMLCTLSISVFLPLGTAFTWGKLASFLGASFFLASDGVLCDMLFTKKAEPTRQNFAVMGRTSLHRSC